jgi:peptide subunit release factor RF-3
MVVDHRLRRAAAAGGRVVGVYAAGAFVIGDTFRV